mgnify:FL=1
MWYKEYIKRGMNMKLLEYKQYNNLDEERSLNKKKVTIAIIVVVLIIIISTISVIYISNSNFRNFMDKYILLKSVSSENLPYINIDTEKSIYTCAYHKYIAILENSNLTLYNSSGKEVERLNIDISSPIFATQDNYLAIAEKDKQKVYLVKDKKILWEKEVEGKISRININENGYVSVIVSGTSYKSVITTYSQDGTEIFKTFLSSTVAIDVDISKDNKYLSFCEMDLSGTLIESKVKTISIEKAKQDPSNSIMYTYEIPSNVLVTNLEYHEKDELMCACDKEIYVLKNGNMQTVTSLDESNITFAGVKLSKSYFKVIEDIQGINNQNTNIEIHNTANNNAYLYTINGVAKEVYSQNGVIAVNLGTEAYFINETGWLIKKYTSTQEIKKIVVSSNIAGIIYRNRIEFIDL